MNTKAGAFWNCPEVAIDVVERGRHARKGRIALELERDIKFSTGWLESYAFAKWEPVMYDALVLAAAIEYGDKIIMRSLIGWARRIALRIPVHNPSQWNSPAVAVALRDALEFLTGDYWFLEFVHRSKQAPSPPQNFLNLSVETQAVLAYSDGMDSRSVAEIVSRSLGDKLVRVRVGSNKWDHLRGENKQKPFTIVPYSVACRKSNKEPSARSRGFKFLLITAIAAYLTEAKEVVIPESGQGVIGPALITLGHVYPDYRNHPLFAVKMAKFINTLLSTQIRFIFPRIWHTKGETLREFVSLSERGDWESTKSCWRGNNWSSVNGKYRQCGICAACMLRRVSVHAAGLIECPDAYVTTDLSAEKLEDAIDKDFIKFNRAFREYAIAGVLHLAQLADMASADANAIVKRHATLIAPALNISCKEAESRLGALFQRHSEEWRNYLESLGVHSFLKRWAGGNQ